MLQRRYGPQSLKYLLSVPLPKKFTYPSPRELRWRENAHSPKDSDLDQTACAAWPVSIMNGKCLQSAEEGHVWTLVIREGCWVEAGSGF